MSLPRPYYQDSAVTLYHGDCREIVPLLGRFDLLLTDPPYGIGKDKGAASGGMDGSGRYLRRPKQYEGDWDRERPAPELFYEIISASRSAVIWGGNYFADILPRGGRWLFWDKKNNMPSFSDGEIAWTNMKGVSVKKFTHYNQCVDDTRGHPTQKPLELISWCLSFFPDAKTILDPFAGSGTTGRAAKDLGRKCVLIEREEKYCEIAARRMAQEVLPFS
jgi:DNA modification methylase